jgi:hypothetical protein
LHTGALEHAEQLVAQMLLQVPRQLAVSEELRQRLWHALQSDDTWSLQASHAVSSQVVV